jgi:hypothetical protein
MIYKHYRRLVKPVEAEKFWNIVPSPALADSANVPEVIMSDS